MIGILIGIGAILLATKGFGREGLPVTRKKRMTGTGAKVVAVICLLIGLALIADGIYSLEVLTRGTH